jgi:hypothetical protein
MARLLLISMGQLTGTVLEAIARRGSFSEIVVASRNPAAAERKLNNARIGAAIEGRFPAMRAVGLDFNETAAAGRILAGIRPDIAFAAPSLMPWWRIDQLVAAGRTELAAMPFAGWLACHLAPMLALARAWEASRLDCPWIGASYPDLVNAVLHRDCGRGPISGAGNIEEAVPKLRFVAADALGADPAELEIWLVAQHALEYFLYAPDEAGEPPPCMLRVLWRGRDISAEVERRLFRPMPIPYDLDFNRLTASAASLLLEALIGEAPQRLHVPAPRGLVGGYPVVAAAGRIDLDLPPGWALDQARACNEASLAWDGVAAIDADGTVRYTDRAAAALNSLLGEAVASLEPAAAPALAGKLLAALGVSRGTG